MTVGLDVAAQALTEALSGRTCSSAWLGYGDVLFLGFGNVSFAEVPPRIHGTPEYKVQTNFADWTMETVGPPGAVLEPEQAKQAVHSLVGKSVTGWRLIDGHGFQIEFDVALRLRVVPWTDADSTDTDAWCVGLPGNRVVAVSCDGRVASVDSREPIRDWFRRDRG
jgi:hypothetical protein